MFHLIVLRGMSYRQDFQSVFQKKSVFLRQDLQTQVMQSFFYKHKPSIIKSASYNVVFISIFCPFLSKKCFSCCPLQWCKTLCGEISILLLPQLQLKKVFIIVNQHSLSYSSASLCSCCHGGCMFALESAGISNSMHMDLSHGCVLKSRLWLTCCVLLLASFNISSTSL